MNGPVVFVSGGEGGGGVHSFLRDLAPAVADQVSAGVIHLGLVNLPLRPPTAPDNFSVETLALDPCSATGLEQCSKFLAWVKHERPSVVLLNDVSQIENAWAYIPKETRLIVVVHDEGWRYRRAVVEKAETVDLIVVVAPYLRDVLANDKADLMAKIAVIGNGIRFPADIIPRTRETLKGRELRVLYAGSMDWFRKGIQDLPLLAKALMRLRAPFRLVIVGGVDVKLQQRFSEIGASGNVDWLGRMDRDELLRVADSCDFFFLPSRSEAFGLVTVEAMGMGCVPFAYDIESGTREIVKDGESGLLFPLGKVQAVAAKMNTLRQQDDAIAALRNAAIRRAREDFCIERSAELYAQVIENVVERPSARESPSREKLRMRPQATIGNRGGPRFQRFFWRVIQRFPRVVRYFWRRHG